MTCTILRTYVKRTGTLNLVTGKVEMTHEETSTGPCNTPLFGAYASEGICSGCRDGWETEGNVFASETERQRATTM